MLSKLTVDALERWPEMTLSADLKFVEGVCFWNSKAEAFFSARLIIDLMCKRVIEGFIQKKA